MTTLRDFIANRRTEIRREIASLKAEMRELDVAESAIVGKPLEVPPASRDANGTSSAEGTHSLTLKKMSVDVLTGRPEGAEANRIVDLIKDRFGVEVPRSSLSPQLSRLGAEGVLIRRGYNWKLAEYAAEQSNADEVEQEASSPAGSDGTGKGAFSGVFEGADDPLPASEERGDAVDVI